MALVGRFPELTACRGALSADLHGARAAVITGPPGIGKTTLWLAVAESQPAGTIVLRTTGVSGGQAALASLADLLDPVTDTMLPQLAEPQASALRAALGLAPSQAPVTGTLLERAVLGVLRGLAPGGVVVAVDDEQWVDGDSRRLLEAAAVRLNDVPVRWLVTVRSGHTDQGLARVLDHELGPRTRRIELAHLGDAELSELVLSRFPGRWSPGVLRQVLTLAAGNPYTALEVARETVACGGPSGTAAHVPSTLDSALRSRLGRLGSQALAVVQAAALTAAPTRALLRAVAAGPVEDQVDAALEAGVLQASPPDPVLRFSHPLLREVAEGMLTGPRRRRLHRAIGAVLDDQHEAAWHLSCGAEEPDEALAHRVEQAAEHASSRGAQARAAALAHAAVGLTPDPDSLPAWRRRVLWISLLRAAGEFDQARRLGDQWAPRVPEQLRGRLAFSRAQLQTDLPATHGLLANAFRDFDGRDPARAALADAQIGLILGVQSAGLDQARPHAVTSVEHAREAGDPVVLRGALAGEGFLAALAGEAGAGDRLRAAVALPGFTDTPYPFFAPETALALWHLWRGELGPSRDLLQTVITVAQQHGSGECAFNARIVLTYLEWQAGHWDEAATLAAAAARWSRESGRGQDAGPAYAVSLVEAGRGEIEHARRLAAEGVRQAEAQQDRTFAILCRWVLAQIELSVDDPHAARQWLEPIADTLQDGGIGEPAFYPFTPDLVEAWAATGQFGRAADRLTWLRDAAERLDHPWARITSGRADAVLRLAQRDPARAAEAVTAVIPEARGSELPFELARCLLVLGIAQRKARQRRDGAQSLDEAAAIFRRLGAPRWQALAAAQRARLAPASDHALTSAERRVAELVATGHSNPEIASALFISVKTVEANLTRIYRKLGLRTRVDLARHSLT